MITVTGDSTSWLRELKNYGHKIRANRLVYPGIDLNPKIGQYFVDIPLGVNLENRLMTFGVQRYSCVPGINYMRRMYL